MHTWPNTVFTATIQRIRSAHFNINSWLSVTSLSLDSVSRLNVNCNWPSLLTGQPAGFIVWALQMNDRQVSKPQVCNLPSHREQSKCPTPIHNKLWQIKVESQKDIILKSYTAHTNNRYYMHYALNSFPKPSNGVELMLKFLDSITSLVDKDFCPYEKSNHPMKFKHLRL